MIYKLQSKTKFALIVLCLIAGSLAHAQPQAPVVWGDMQLLGICDDSTAPLQVLPMGDTLVFHGFRVIGSSSVPYVSYSYDNGVSHSVWQWVGPTDTSDVQEMLAGSNGYAYFFFYGWPGQLDWMRRSSDGGASWGQRQNVHTGGPTVGLACGSQVYQFYIGLLNERWVPRFGRSDDFGATWPLDATVDTIIVIPDDYQSIARTQRHVLVVARRPSGSPDRWIWVARSDDEGESWVPFDTLAGQSAYGAAALYSIAADTMSETAIVTILMQIDFAGPYKLVYWRTTDGGQTWEPPAAATDSATVANPSDEVGNFCRGKLWGLVWRDLREAYPARVLYWRFSANHGRNWYPAQTVVPVVRGAGYFCGQFVNDEVRIYWHGFVDSTLSFDDFATATGILTPDTVAPSVQPSELPPDTVSVSAQLLFLVSVVENDTLSRVDLEVRDLDSVSTVPMTWTGTDYSARWTVPHAGRYFYRIEAEDWWENLGSYPDTGWAMFVTPGWVDDANPVIPHPSAFILSSSPNPFNPTTNLSFSLPQTGHAKLTVYDLTGRQVRILADENFIAGQHSVPFDGTALSSGVYFARLEAGKYMKTEKLMLLK